MIGADTIIVTQSNGVATITLNRPDRLNAITAEMGSAFNRAVLDADDDPEVRVIVITGAGRGFCAGADLEYLADESAGGRAIHPEEGIYPELLMRVRKPVVAAVNGATAGVGFALMLMADVRFVAIDAKLTTSYARLGLVAEYGTSWLLPRLIGVADALDLLFTGRKITGDEAVRLGIARRALPAAEVVSAAASYAESIATSCSPVSLAAIKRQVYADQSATFAEALNQSASMMVASFAHPDVTEGITAQQQRRPPNFASLEQRSPDAGRSTDAG